MIVELKCSITAAINISFVICQLLFRRLLKSMMWSIASF